MEAQIAVDRFKWFDFLGAVLLLVSVTRSALLPHGGSDQPDVAPTPSQSEIGGISSLQSFPQETSDQSLGLALPHARAVLEMGSDTVHEAFPSAGVNASAYSNSDCESLLQDGQLDDSVGKDSCPDSDEEELQDASSTLVSPIIR
jgi:hypothetical protein